VGQEHLPGALVGEAALEAHLGPNATPRVGIPGVKATPRVGLPGVKATLRVGLLEDKAIAGDQGPRGSEGLRKTHTAALGAKLQALIPPILPLLTPQPVL